MTKLFRDERGQSGVLIALSLVAVFAFVALVVDGANIYAQRRKVQNAVDAASYAGTETLARPVNGQRATNGQVYNAVWDYARRNGVDPDTACPHPNPKCVKAYYLLQAAGGVVSVDSHTIDWWGNFNYAPTIVDGKAVAGVHVVADKQFNSYFAGVVGLRNFEVGSGAGARGVPPAVVPPAQATPPVPPNGTCCGEDLFPVTVSQTAFSDENGDGLRDIHFEESDPTYNYILWEKKLTAPGNFGYLKWRDQNPDATTLEANMHDPTRSGRWNVGDWVPSSTGAMNSSGVRAEWVAYIGRSIILPIYDQTRGTGNNTEYRIVGFAKFKVTGVCRFNNYQGACDVRDLQNNSEPYVQGKFQQWVSSACEGACPNYGITTTKNRPPTNPQRTLQGVVKINKLIPAQNTTITQQHIPVDVVHVLDISGSMGQNFGSPAREKLAVAKQALISFNTNISTTLGDRVGLATYPNNTTGTRYNYSCQSNGNTTEYYSGRNRQNLTNNKTTINNIINGLTANGYTPIAGGLLVGRQMVLDPAYHTAGNVPVIILASDGLANVRLNGQRTGFDGLSYNDIACNRPAVQDAIDQANIAKSDGNGDGKPDVIIFTIAIGSNFNPVALQAIASEPVATHFFQATDAASMQNIYDQISSRVQQIGNECSVSQQEMFAPSAIVRVRNTTTGQTYQTTATSTGFFQFINIPAGTYEFTSVSTIVGGFTYDIFTDGVGGPVLASNPTIVVGDGAATYEKSIALKTDDFTCP